MEQNQQVAQQQNTEISEQEKFTFLQLITRTIAAFGGGVAGTIVLLIIYLLASSVLMPVLSASEDSLDANPLFIFVLMGMVFASTLAANLLAPLFISFTQKGRYARVTTSMFQIFISNVVIFVIMIAIYLFATGISTDFTSFAAGLHIAFSVLASAMIFEIISNYKYALLGVYSTIFAVLAGIVFNIILFQATGTATILLFVALPVLWGGIGFLYGIFTMLYQWVVNTWGTDYLATTQEYSKDYGIPEEPVETIVDEPEPEDTEGVDFLRKDDTPETPETPEEDQQNPPQA